MPPFRPAREQLLKGIGERVLAALCFSLMAALYKLVSTRGVSAPELLFYRAAFALPVILAWVLVGPGLASLRTQRPLAHAWRAAIGMASMFCFLQSLVLLPLAESTTINFTAPVFATLLSWLILREKVGPHRWAAVLAGFLGVLIILRPAPGGISLPLSGVAVGLAGALFVAGVTITLRQLSDSEHIAATSFWYTVALALVGLALLPFFGRVHDWTTVAVLLAAGTAAGIGQLLITASLGKAPVAVLMPFDYLQLLCAILFGFLLFAVEPTVNTILGAMLIIASGLYTAWRERRQHLARLVSASAAAAPG